MSGLGVLRLVTCVGGLWLRWMPWLSAPGTRGTFGQGNGSMRRDRVTRRPTMVVGAGLVSVVLAAGLGGCSSGEPVTEPSSAASSEAPASPSPSPSPVDPVEAAKAERIAEAERRFEEYVAISEKHQKAGTSGFEELFNNGYLGNAEMHASNRAGWERLGARKVKQVGDVRIDYYRSETYEAGDPLEEDITGHRIQFVVCADYSEMDLVKPDGSSTQDDSFPDRRLLVIVMQGQPPGTWSVVQDGASREEC